MRYPFLQFVGKYDVVVNCTGIGSRQLIGDTSVYPVRGQVLRVSYIDRNIEHLFEISMDIFDFLFILFNV